MTETIQPGSPADQCRLIDLSHVTNIRHIQHHTAQLSLRLRLDANVEIPWVGSVSS